MNNLNSYFHLLVKFSSYVSSVIMNKTIFFPNWKKLYCARSKNNLLIYNYYNLKNISRYFLI